MSWAALRWVLLMFLVSLPAMAHPRSESESPREADQDLVGNSSWYGPGFNGRRPLMVSASTPKPSRRHTQDLPFGSSSVWVTTRNGKFEIVRINDGVPIKKGAKLMYPSCRRKIGLIHSA